MGATKEIQYKEEGGLQSPDGEPVKYDQANNQDPHLLVHSLKIFAISPPTDIANTATL